MNVKSNLQLARELKMQFNQINPSQHSRGRVKLARSNIRVMLNAQKVSNEMEQTYSQENTKYLVSLFCIHC